MKKLAPNAQVIIPEIRLPFPVRLNSHVENTHARSIWWVSHFGLVGNEIELQRFCKARFAQEAAYTSPDASLEALTIVTYWYIWLFILDDQFEDDQFGRNPQHAHTAIESLKSVLLETASAQPGGNLAKSLHDLWLRTKQCTTTYWQHHFAQNLIAFLDSFSWEAHNRVRAVVPDLETYIANRRKTLAVGCLSDLVELAQSPAIYLPPHIYESQQFQALQCCLGDELGWLNDIYSFQKEFAHGDINNLVFVIQNMNACYLQEAVNVACTMVNNKLDSLISIEQDFLSLPSENKQGLQRYLTGLHDLLAGAVAWATMTGRYLQPEYALSGQSKNYLEEMLRR